MEISINYLAVLVAAVAAYAVGAIWYSFLFQRPWMALMGFTPESMRTMPLSMAQAMGLGFGVTLLTTYVMAHFVEMLEAFTVPMALQLAFWSWLGFIAATQIGSYLWEGKPLKLFFINASQTLVATIVMTLILALWQ